MIIKESLDGHDIIYLNTCGQEFVFRTLGIKEYNDINICVTTDKDIEDAICQATLVYPQGYKFSECPYAGIIPIASKAIKEASGVDNLDLIMDRMLEHKQDMNRFDMQCMNLVKAAFPEYKYDEIIEWPWVKLIDYAVRAEAILNIRGIEVQLVDRRNYNEEDEDVEVEPTKKEIGEELREQGYDPMRYFANDYINKENNVIDFPLIGGLHWDREDVIDAIREQMAKKR